MTTIDTTAIRRLDATGTGARVKRLRLPRVRITQGMVVYVGLMLFVLLAAMNSQANLLFGVSGLMLGVLIVSWGLTRRILDKLVVEREIPELAGVGESATVVYHFHNGKRFWPALSVTLTELDAADAFDGHPRSFLLHAPARGTVEVASRVVPSRRGVHHLGKYRLSTGFPFGFVHRAGELEQGDRIVVHPPIAAVDPAFLNQCRSAEDVGSNMRPRQGGQDEFYGLKEYRGENPRSIYWRRSARTGQLVSKVMTRVAPPRLLLAVDTHVATGRRREDFAAVERAIAMAGSIAAVALEHGLAVGAVAWGGDRWSQVLPTDGKRQRREILTALAELPVNRTRDTEQLLAVAREIALSSATIVLVTTRIIESSKLDQARGRLLVLSTANPQVRDWFRFADTIDFARAMPLQVEPMIDQENLRNANRRRK